MNEIIIHTNKSAYIIHLLSSILFGIIGFAAFIYKDNLCLYFANRIILSNQLFWIFWCCLFGVFIGILGTIYCIFSLFKPDKFIMKINNDGFLTNTYGFVAWKNISSLNLDSISGSNYITFNIKEGVLEHKVATDIFSNPYVISLFYTGVNAKKLYNTMQQYLMQYQQ